MKFFTPKRIFILIIELIITETISIIIQKGLSNKINNITMKQIIDNAIIIGTILVIIIMSITFIYWKIKDYVAYQNYRYQLFLNAVYSANLGIDILNKKMDKPSLVITEKDIMSIMTLDEWNWYKAYNWRNGFEYPFKLNESNKNKK